MSAPWVTYRPEIKVLDCTVRDGGLVNDHMFDDGLVKAVYEACIEAGIDYMELGYKASKKLFAPSKFGAWKYCDEDDMRRIVGDNDSPLKLAAMTDAEKTDYHTDVLPKEQSVLDLIRVATYVHQIPIAVDMINDAHDKGYEVACNLMAVSTVQDAEVTQALEVLIDTPASTIVVVDSFGSLYAEQIELLVKKYRKALEGTDKEVGIHAHNNQQLGFANTIEAIIHGANRDRRHGGGNWTGSRQLSDGALDRLPAKPQVQDPAHPAASAGPVRLAAREGRVGTAGALQPHRPAQSAPASSHRIAQQ